MHEPDIGSARMPPPQRTRTLEVPQPAPKRPTPHQQATARFIVPMDEHTVPHLRAGLDIAQQPLQPFEAHIASFIDGMLPVPELARAAQLPEIEVKVVLKALFERGLLELHRRPGAPFPRTPTGELPVLDGQDFLTPEPMALGDEDEEEPSSPPPARTPPPAPPRAVAPVRPLTPVAPPPAPPAAQHTPAVTPSRGTAPARPMPAATPARGSTVASQSSTALKPVAAASQSSTKLAPVPAAAQSPTPLTPVRGTAPVAPPITHSTTSMPAVQVDVHARATVSVQAVQPRPPRPVGPLEAPASVTVSSAPSTPEDFLQRASRLERQGEVDRAIDTLTRGIERLPEAAVLHSKLALILVNQRKDYARAVKLLERASELEPDNTLFQQSLLKVTSLAAASAGARKEQKRGLFARLTGR